MRSYLKVRRVSAVDELPGYDIADLTRRDVQEGYAEIAPPMRLPLNGLLSELESHCSGDVEPHWVEEANNSFSRGLTISKVNDVVFLPRYGVVVDANGRLFECTAGEVLSVLPLESLPYFHSRNGFVSFSKPRDLPEMDAGAIFVARGGMANYGHFLLDCLTSLLAIESAGYGGLMPMLSPGLRTWHRELIAAIHPEFTVNVCRESALKLSTVVFASSMDHFLHHPTSLVVQLRDRILDRLGAFSGIWPLKLYFSRRGQARRIMANEADFELALSIRGFLIIRPENISPLQQIALARRASVIVAPSGAALANVLFAPQGCVVLELQPSTFQSHWVLLLCNHIGVDWHGLFFDVRKEKHPANISLARWRHFDYSYVLPIHEALSIVDGFASWNP